MVTPSFVWNVCKSSLTFGLIGLTISDRVASIVPVRGFSMSPTFNPDKTTSLGLFTDDHVLVEKRCLMDYRFSHGDVVVFCSPSSYKEKHMIKRITGMPGDWISLPYSYDAVKVPEGHCWVEGDNPTDSLDSRSFGPIPLGWICLLSSVFIILKEGDISNYEIDSFTEAFLTTYKCHTHIKVFFVNVTET
ncbi:unnamed protein product [Lactuca virosa]|uniref:Mitochondrial inner membrane protease subunit 2 n=1 Tax=Lactuca virosa TaxID=75947 RepID=A0AAU9NJZ4_9ASTR|nr:unnamed protein product [Lactuca virosa]